MKRRLAGIALVWLVAAPLLAVGLGALSVALWLVLEALRGAAFAWAVLGLIYLAAGLVTMAVAALLGRARRDAAPPAQVPLGITLATMAEAFVTGFAAGARLRRGRPEGGERSS